MSQEKSISTLGLAFPPHHLDEWLKKVRKELGTSKKLNDLNWLVEEGINLDFLPHPKHSYPPISWKSDHNWRVSEIWTHLPAPEEWDILNRYAIDELMLHLSDPDDIEKLCTSLPPDHPTISLVIDPACLPAIIDSESGDQIAFLKVYPLGESSMIRLSKADPKFNWRYADNNSPDVPTADLAAIIHQLIGLLGNEKDPDLISAGRYRVYLNISDQYLVEIAKIRALKILLLNLWKAFDLPYSSLPEIYCQIKGNLAHDSYTNLITSTTRALAAVNAGADVIYFDNLMDRLSESSRLSRNIHYILKYESHLNHRIDPLAGSFLIENLTEAFVVNVWNKIRGMEQ